MISFTCKDHDRFRKKPRYKGQTIKNNRRVGEKLFSEHEFLSGQTSWRNFLGEVDAQEISNSLKFFICNPLMLKTELSVKYAKHCQVIYSGIPI